MKKIKYLIVILILAGVFYSCEEAFTTVKELEIPEHEKKLTVFSEISGDYFQIFVSHSKSIDDTNRYKIIKANVILNKNGKEYLNILYPDDMITGDFISPGILLKEKAKKGEVYTLEVISNELGTAKASQTVPPVPDISGISYVENYYFEEYDTLGKLEFEIADPEGEDNYYFLSVNPTFYKVQKYHLFFSVQTEDPIVKKTFGEFGSGVIISDKTFDGQKRNIALKIGYYASISPDDQNFELDTLILNVKGITKDYYNFVISRIQYEQVGENPFAEPVSIHNNIENGYGLFSVDNYKSVIVKIK